jgi:predicted nucleic acid-binding protein
MAVIDSMLAATALTHGLTMVTRNVDDFKAAGITLLNPFV